MTTTRLPVRQAPPLADARLGMRHQFRNSWRMSRAFAIGAIVMTVLLHGFAVLAAALHGRIADPGVTVATVLPLAAGLWSALALLPALGGGESDDPMALAAAGAGRSFRFGARFASSLTDAGPGLFVPALALVGAAVAGWPGWLAGLALAFNGLACGQLSGAASAILVVRVGPTAALLIVSGVILLSATVLASSGIGPGAWWLAAIDQPGYDLLLVVTGVAALVGAWALNRPAEQAVRAGRTVRVPRAEFAAVFVTMLLGVSRSVMARSTLVTAVLTPLLVRSAGAEVTASIAFFVTAAAAAVLGANGFAYDGGAPVWLLGKASRTTLLVARLLTTTVWAFLLSVVAAASAALVGAAPPVHLLPHLVLVAIGAAAAGLVPSVTRPTTTDFNSFRAQPAPVASAIGTLARSVVLTTVVLAVPLGVAAAVVLGYAAIALAHARWVLRDPVALAALA
jgi:hypothetical protein